MTKAYSYGTRRHAGVSAFVAFAALLSVCASLEPINPAYFNIEPGPLPKPDTTLGIARLGPCTDNPDRTLHLDANKPARMLVHGCFGSSCQFRGLAQVMAFHGQQAACFTDFSKIPERV